MIVYLSGSLTFIKDKNYMCQMLRREINEDFQNCNILVFLLRQSAILVIFPVNWA